MNNLFIKEIKLSSSILSYLFIVFGFMFLLPGYPILCSAFFVTLGIFQSFQSTREANDIIFSCLLPLSKKEIVKGKIMFVTFIEICAFIMMVISTILRMTLLKDALVYKENALMNANFFALGASLVIFSIFNLIFVAGFFKTGYKFAKSFLIYIIVTIILIAGFESLHYIPGLESINSFGFDNLSIQLISLFIGIVLFLIITILSYKLAKNRFNKVDL